MSGLFGPASVTASRHLTTTSTCITASPRHPAHLKAVDRGYLVSWARDQIICAAVGGAIAGAVITLLAIEHNPLWAVAALPLLGLVALLVLFFRNPTREIPSAPGLLVAPADGTITDITLCYESEFLGGPAVRIGIFLSVFDVHVNRSPASGRIDWLLHREGAHHDARDPAAELENESNSIGIVREDAGGPPSARLLVRQISGAIARRIVCPLEPGDLVERGGLMGMIKYGSRTELYFPAALLSTVRVSVGDKVRGGASVLVQILDP